MMNPIAQYHMEITVDDVDRSPMVADPLHVLDCSPISDGAAAVVLAPTEIAAKLTDTPVRIAGSAQASDTLALHDRRDLTTLDATVVAGRAAFAQAGIEPRHVDVAEVHDCFTIAEILAIEDLGFVEKGQGGRAAEEGITALGRASARQYLGRPQGLRSSRWSDGHQAGLRDSPPIARGGGKEAG